MTKEDKLAAIVDRIHTKSIDINSKSLSALMLSGYVDALAKAGIFAHGLNVTSSGQDVISICEEFEWEPDDNDIIEFAKEVTNSAEDQPSLICLLKLYRNDRNKLMKEFADRKNREDQ